ncbi:MAG TPA: hypothetical protein VMS01_04365 [Stellaceae bacterium]|nr:hypothetical protein [Stellaceae bacterium]
MFWGKHHVGMITDDKLVTAADMAGASPLLGPVVFGALFERTIENGDGTFRGFQPRVLAYKFRVKVEEVERLIAAFVELGIVAGERLVNWAKRQGAAAIEAGLAAAKSVDRAITKSAERMRRKRERDAAAHRQGELFTAAAKEASHRPVTASHPGVTCDATASLPPAPPTRDIYKNTPQKPPQGGARSARMQIAEREGEGVQGEILMPLDGGRRRPVLDRPPRMTERERRRIAYHAMLANWVARVEAAGGLAA